MNKVVKKVLLLFLILGPALGFAQQPKMYLKVFGGTNSHKFIYRSDTISSDNLLGYQFGFGFRVSRRNVFGEVDFSFTRFGVKIATTEESEIILEDDINVRINNFELPLNVGYIPVKTPLVKWYLYGGVVNRFSVRGILKYKDETIKFKPKELNLPVYNLDFQVGTQVDVAMFNFDLRYKIGVTNALREAIRTNLHALYFTVGFIF